MQSWSESLRYLIAAGRRDRDLSRRYGLTLASIASRAGTSPRSLGRYLTGERSPPPDVALRLLSLARDLSDEIGDEFRDDAIADEIPYVTTKSLPLQIRRYQRPRSTTGEQQRSEIIEVDTENLSYATIYSILTVWWRYLKQRGGKWDVRFLTLVSVRDYFGAGGPRDKELRKRVRGERHVPLWVPPTPFIFVDSNKRAVAGRYRKADDAIEVVNQMLQSQYRTRILDDYGILRIAFIPYLGPNTKRRQRRRK